MTIDKKLNCSNGLPEKPLLQRMLLYYKPRSTLFYHKIFYQLSTICRDFKNIMNPYINEKNVKIKKDKHDFVTNDHHTCHSFWLLCAKAKKIVWRMKQGKCVGNRKKDRFFWKQVDGSWCSVLNYFSFCHKFLPLGMRWGFPPGMQAYSPHETGSRWAVAMRASDIKQVSLTSQLGSQRELSR